MELVISFQHHSLRPLHPLGCLGCVPEPKGGVVRWGSYLKGHIGKRVIKEREALCREGFDKALTVGCSYDRKQDFHMANLGEPYGWKNQKH